MNKKLLALAVASAVTAPLSAFADGSLNIYGGVGMAVESIDTDVQSALGVNSNHSALGFEGSMGLNNGMDAVFHYDTFVNLDGSGDTLFDGGRDGWAGLRGGGFGTVALGFQGRPWKTLSHALDPFEGTIADYSSVIGSANGSYFDGGIGHSIIWFGPNMNGLSWHVQYGAEEVEDGANNMGAQIHYSNDMYFVGVSYDVDEGVGAGQEDAKAMKLVGSINLNGGFTITGAFDSISGAGFVDGADRDAFWLAGSYKMGDTRFSLAYATADELDNAADTGGSQVSLGIFHNLAENTTVYAIFSSISNDDSGSYRFVSAPHTSTFDSGLYSGGAAGDDSSAIALGIKYNFSADLM